MKRPAAALLALAIGLGTGAPTGAQGQARTDAPLPIEAGTSLWAEELTWMEIRDLVKAGTTTIVIGTGGVEQNGPYVAGGKHNFVLQTVLPYIARAIPKSLIAPIVKFVPEGRIEPTPGGHMSYPGTISLEPATYEALLTDICRSYKAHGFVDIILLGDSGGNQGGMKNVAEALNRKWAAERARVHFLPEYYDEDRWSYDYLKTLGVTQINKTPGQPADARTDTRNGMHDDIYYESQIAVMDPKLIRAEERRKAGLLNLHGVDESSIARVVEIGKKLAEYRAGITARAFKASQDRVRTPPAAPRPLDIYWIDVEGGASTLIVTPQGQSVLMDAGFGGFDDRDASRVERVVKKEAGLSRIDHVLVSHFHGDHAGGLAALAKRIDIGSFVDHGDSIEKNAGAGKQLWDEYVATAGSRRRTVKPGDRLPLDGVELTIVASDGQALKAPVTAAGPNPLCDSFKSQAEDAGENGRSVGYLLRAGKFEFVNLGDLSWNFQRHLACPANLLGTIDLFQVPHHGVRDDVLPQLMWALAPAVAVMNNGPAKGAGPAAVETVLRSPGLEDLWSLHRAVANDAAHNAAERVTANLGDTEGCKGDWISARLTPDGSYTLTNSRNGFSKTYRVK